VKAQTITEIEGESAGVEASCGTGGFWHGHRAVHASLSP